MSADAADVADADADADADAAAERRLNHSIPRTYFVRGIQLCHSNFLLSIFEINTIYSTLNFKMAAGGHFGYFLKSKFLDISQLL